MEQFCHTLLTMTAAASVAALGVMLLRLPLKKAPRWITCALWLVVFLRMACPVGLSLPVSLMPRAISDGAVAQQVLPVPPAEAPAQVTAMEPPTLSDTDTVPVPVVSHLSPAEPADPQWPAVAFPVWAVGTAAAVLWAAVSYGNLRRRISDAVLVQDNMYETDQIDTPFVCGFIKPSIYLPVGMNEADRRYVLLHEQAHIRRFDYLTKPLAYLTLCVHWFNPILWLAYRLFCRDVETSCDQSVTHAFDREDTAGYAAALLHLGQRSRFPHAVPLAFGEEDAKGRIKSVLNYKRPAFWVIVAAVAACAAAAVLLLSDHSSSVTTLDEVEISHADVVELLSYTDYTQNLGTASRNTTVDLPQDLREDLLDLLDTWGHSDYGFCVPMTTFPDRTISLSGPDDTIQFYLLHEEGQPDDALTLVRVTQEYPTDRWQQADVKPGQGYADWQAQLEQYLYIGRADALYQQKVPDIGDSATCQTLLDALNIEEVAGPYTLELQTEEHPYTIALHFKNAPENEVDGMLVGEHLWGMPFLLLPLTENAEQITWTFPDTDLVHTYGRDYDPRLTDTSLQDYRNLYALHHEDLVPYAPGRPSGKAYSVKTVLSLSPQAPDALQSLADSAKDRDSKNRVILREDYFSLRISDEGYSVDCPLPLQESRDIPTLILPDGSTFDLAPADSDEPFFFFAICKRDGTDTGYRFCFRGSGIYLVYYNTEDLANGQETLEAFFEIEQNPG